MPRASLRPIVTVVATVLVMGSSIYGVLLAAARSGDAHQAQIEETIVASALAQIEKELRSVLHQNATWGLAYDAMGEDFNAAWARQQLVPDAITSNTEITLITDPHARIVFQFDRNKADRELGPPQKDASLDALLSRALKSALRPPVAQTAFVSWRGRIYLAAAQMIVPDDTRNRRTLEKHFALVYLVPLNARLLRNLGLGFHIDRIGIAPSPQAKTTSLPLWGGQGKPVAWLTWRAAQPGRDFVSGVAPIALAVFVLMGVLQLAALKSWSKASERMRDEGVARTMFLANVSHELRTPLNAIIGFSECMSCEMFGKLTPKYKDYANDILMSGKYLLGIVDDVLDLTQLNSTDSIALEPLTLADAIARPLKILREYAKADDIEIEFADHSGDAMVAANQKAISQLLLNLGSNAVKFSPRGAMVHVALRRAVGTVEIAVRDRGVGIPQDKLRLVGQPFLQAHNGTARRPGSGLGLAIVKTLAEKLSGHLQILSTEGEGTTAIVRLPIMEEEAVRVAQPAVA